MGVIPAELAPYRSLIGEAPRGVAPTAPGAHVTRPTSIAGTRARVLERRGCFGRGFAKRSRFTELSASTDRTTPPQGLPFGGGGKSLPTTSPGRVG